VSRRGHYVLRSVVGSGHRRDIGVFVLCVVGAVGGGPSSPLASCACRCSHFWGTCAGAVCLLGSVAFKSSSHIDSRFAVPQSTCDTWFLFRYRGFVCEV